MKTMKRRPRKDGAGSKIESHTARKLPVILSDAYGAGGTCELNKFLVLKALKDTQYPSVKVAFYL
jgi:hypothetical protein